MSAMADELRQQYAAALAETCRLHETVDNCDRCERRLNAIMAVRDEELERLRRQAGWHGDCVPITKWAEELRDKLNAVGQRDQTTQRAETAEAAIARVRRLCELTIAASCRVQAIEQAQDTLTVLDDTNTDIGAAR